MFGSATIRTAAIVDVRTIALRGVTKRAVISARRSGNNPSLDIARLMREAARIEAFADDSVANSPATMMPVAPTPPNASRAVRVRGSGTSRIVSWVKTPATTSTMST